MILESGMIWHSVAIMTVFGYFDQGTKTDWLIRINFPASDDFEPYSLTLPPLVCA